MQTEKAALLETEVLDELPSGIKIVQDVALYRFTSDSVLLSKFVRLKKGDAVADFCAGSGIVAYHLYAQDVERAKGVSFTLFELQKPLLNLAKKTAEINGLNNFSFVEGRLQDLDKDFNGKFSLITCNPPYERGGFDNDEYEKAICRKEITITLADIAKAAGRALKFGGRLCMLHRADRIAEVCYTLKNHGIEVKKIQFVGGRDGMKPYLALIEGVKGGKPTCEILPTLINEKDVGTSKE